MEYVNEELAADREKAEKRYVRARAEASDYEEELVELQRNHGVVVRLYRNAASRLRHRAKVELAVCLLMLLAYLTLGHG